ncbi:MAG: DNA glycosylase [Capsulimonadaceae bacterium]
MEYLCPTVELDVEHTVFGGQAFRWVREGNDWACLLAEAVSGEDVLVRLRVDVAGVWFETEPEDRGEVVRDYLRLDVDLQSLTRAFAAADPRIAVAVDAFPGLRVLRQDPVECFFSFLCTPAAPLHRIRRNIDQLCRSYGRAYTGASGQAHYSFPSVDAIAAADESVLFQFGLGYRAKFLRRAAAEVADRGGASWLRGLRVRPYADSRASLMSLPGVGAKIADCVSLFSLDHDEAVPCDTHVRRMVETYYRPDLAGRSLTPSVTSQIGDALRQRFGPMAGWAQQYLFYQDLYEKRTWGAYQKQLGRTGPQ